MKHCLLFMIISNVDISIINPQLVFWWYIPIIIGSALAVGGLIAAFTPEKTEGKTLGVLGMKGSGKTRFLSNLGLFEYKEGIQGTTVEGYEAHSFSIGDRTIVISQGEDVGGDVDIRGYYNKWVEEKDITIFIFEGIKYLNDSEYQSQVKARLHFIYNIAKTKYGNDSDLKNIVIIISHSDEYKHNSPEDKKELLTSILSTISEKDYKKLFEKNTFAADLRDKKEVLIIAQQIF